MRPTAVLILAALSLPAAAQSIEPGEWEFNGTVSTPSRPSQSVTLKHCVKPEDAGDPTRWMGRRVPSEDCTVKHNDGAGGTWTYEMLCPKQSFHATGRMRTNGNTLEGDITMVGEAQGQRFEMRSRMTGRRIGPCKS